MAETVRDLMTPQPTTVQAGASLADAARVMRDADVGAMVVLEGSRLAGIVTDRDIVTRAVAEARDAMATNVSDIISEDLVTLTPDATLDEAAEVMRDRAVRRVPVVEGDRPVGIISLADLSDHDRGQASETLSEVISAAPNN
jgi:CBS domain-containing protein